jgi:hypothetical protein
MPGSLALTISIYDTNTTADLKTQDAVSTCQKYYPAVCSDLPDENPPYQCVREVEAGIEVGGYHC